jgi:septal ring factor EnvC (AmiA/AmiB activator)
MKALWLALTLLLATLPSLAFAAPPTREQVAANKAAAEQKLNKLRGELNALASEQHDLEGKRSDASKALRDADSTLGAAGRALRDTEDAITSQQSHLQQLEAQQSALQKNLAGQHAALATLLRSAYALGHTEQLKLLLAQDRVSDAGRELAYHHYFEVARLHRIDALTAQLQQLAAVTRQLESERTALAASRAQQRTRLADLQTQRRQQSQVVAQIDSQYRDRAGRVQALGRDADSLESLVKRLGVVMAQAPKPVRAPVVAANRHATGSHAEISPGNVTPELPTVTPFVGPGGRFAWPLEGNVIASYGGAMADGRASTGLLIAGSPGADVHAVADGRVAFADWLKGYGLIIIIDHGDGLMSLYANNEALLKNAGDAVHAGDAVSTVGSSGGQGRNALYFEMRQGGKPVDPRAWLRRR